VLYGTLVGVARDPAGAAVPGANIVVTNQQTGQTRTVATHDNGEYTVPNLLSGSYAVRISAAGFKSFTQTGVQVSISTVTRVDVTLSIGDVIESVTTVGASEPLQTDKTDVHVELSSREVTDLPLPEYRNFQSLMALVPGAAPPDMKSVTADTPGRTMSSEVNGSSQRTSNFTRVDGVLNRMNVFASQMLYVPPSESIQTVNVTTNSYDAEQGMAGGAAITVITKSGTNEFHGSAFAYHTNDALQANNFFSRARGAKSTRTMAGGSLGGPIKKQKLFFFMDWERTRDRSGFSSLLTVAGPEVREGNFGAIGATIYDPMTGSPNGAGRTPFSEGRIPLSRQSSITRKLQALVPLPTERGNSSNYYSAATQPLDRDNADIKMNWNPSPRHTLWAKYNLMTAQLGCEFGLGAAGGTAVCPSGAATSDTLVQVASLGHTWVLSSSFLIESTLGYNRLGQTATSPDYGENFGLNTLGIPGTNGPDIRYSGMPSFNISGYTTLGNDPMWTPLFRRDETNSYSVSAGWIKGAHDIRFGFDLLRYRQNDWQLGSFGSPRGQFYFTGGLTALRGGSSPNQSQSYADFLLGLVQRMQKGIQFYSPQTAREWQFGWYVRDRWQFSKQLTLTLGLRYELYPLMTRAHSGIERYDTDTNKVLLGRLGGNPDNVGIDVSKKLFAPRVGLAYRLRSRTVIRGGFGITIDPTTVSGEVSRPYPAVVGGSFQGLDSYQAFGPIEQGIPAIKGPDVSSGIIDVPLTASTMTQPKGLYHRGSIESWNFIVERQLPLDFVGSAGYVGTHTTNAVAAQDVNSGRPGLGLAGLPLYSRFGRSAPTLLIDGMMSADYHSLQTIASRRMKSGLFVRMAYTFSKAISGVRNGTGAAGGTALLFGSPDQFSRNRALAEFDRTHVLQMAWMYELPFGASGKWPMHGLFRAMLSDWQINGTFSAYTGNPFTVTASATSLNAPGNTQTADQVKMTVDMPKGIGAGHPWFDPTAFAPVTGARYGNSGLFILRGPGLVNANLGVFRAFRLSERFKTQFRAEAFNGMNTPHFNNPSANVSSGGVGIITSARNDQRQFRFALHLRF
jgi:hypothetical protein